MYSSLSQISVLIPVYQCADLLPAHLDFLTTLSGRVHELIWVITDSPDGSCRMAKAAASKLGGKILKVPKGLYEAWNAGIKVATGEYLYISTVGDFMERNDGLDILLGLLQKTGADLATSPPRPYPSDIRAQEIKRHWPLFTFKKSLQRYNGKIIPADKVALIQILSGASGLTGSCASCLFRTRILKDFPFPTDYFHYGDTAWLYKNIPKISIALCQSYLARFNVHASGKPRPVSKKQIYQLASTLLDFLDPSARKLAMDFVWASQRIDAIRDPHPKYGWWFIPKAWQVRAQRESCRRQIVTLIKTNS